MLYLLEMKDIIETPGSVKAIDNVSLRLNASGIIPLCGENGSGRSTLMKVLHGTYFHDSYEGEIIFTGEEAQASHIRDTERKGTAIIHQELVLVKELAVLEDISPGNGITHGDIMDYDLMTLRCQKLLTQASLSISPDTRIGDLGLGQQQLVEIIETLNKQMRLLTLDEPTVSLTRQETSVLLDIIRDLQQHGIACIYTSHKFNEVKAISDTICIVRDGQHIGTRDAAGMSEDDIIIMVVGRELIALYPSEPHTTGGEILRTEYLMVWRPASCHIKRVNDVSFSLKRDGILDVAGLIGTERAETTQRLFGVWSKQQEGEIYIDGRQVDICNYQQAITQGIAVILEDRKCDGIAPVMTAGKGITLVALKRFTGGISQLDDAAEQECILESIQQLKVKTSSPDLTTERLSGGNQQKVILARCLLLNPCILILDEPTKGIDIGAKYEICKLIN